MSSDSRSGVGLGCRFFYIEAREEEEQPYHALHLGFALDIYKKHVTLNNEKEYLSQAHNTYMMGPIVRIGCTKSSVGHRPVRLASNTFGA